jgi:hypothetical protein
MSGICLQSKHEGANRREDVIEQLNVKTKRSFSVRERISKTETLLLRQIMSTSEKDIQKAETYLKLLKLVPIKA